MTPSSPSHIPPARHRHSYRHHHHDHQYRYDRHGPPHRQQHPLLVYQPVRQFIIRLLSSPNHRTVPALPVEAVVSQCQPTPHRSSTSPSGDVVACLVFQDRADALNAFFFLWERRLSGDHLFTPAVDARISEDANERLKILFRLHVEKLLDCESVKKLERKVEKLRLEINSCGVKKSKSRRVISQNQDREKELRAEMEGIVRKIEEFRSGMKCVIDYLEGKEIESGVLRFGTEGGFNWGRLHSLILRESRRLEDGLPLYGFRREILQAMRSQQVMVLIGETGSGKSTQLVQFLTDSGVAAGGSILCTQPRKIAAISLAKRVGEESCGCIEDNSIACYPTFSSLQLFNSKVIYMTDHCLLQHLMKDKTLSEVSCIIIDEAHERSLNTDLLLALIKDLLIQRHDLKLLIMSATVNASKLSDYFFGCLTFYVSGRSFPVKIEYVPHIPRASDPLNSFKSVAPFVVDVVKMAMEIHDKEDEGAILAFLTSQIEVEWACENFQSSSAIAFPLHGKLSHEEQAHVFQNYPGKRKVIFSTNLAETSLTIAGVKFVVDSGMVKESRFELTSGMNVLRVSQISQSSANQRAGRAGRTGPGKCFRLYSESDYQSMDLYQEPEICKVHLGIAVLRILALGIQNIEEFDFIDAPNAKAIDMAIRNLVQLGAVCCKGDVLELTYDGHCMVKLGIEPRLGKIILESIRQGLRKEGVVLASVMANASSIFCRVGTDDDKLRSDSLKVQFCHQGGDLFTLLSVFREWESVHPDCRNKWCWENSINAKTMRRCRDTVLELENSLKNELSVIVPAYWRWDPRTVTDQDRRMKKIILSSLADNVAVYSGYYRLGYQVASSGEYVQLHPSCSLLVYNQRPDWVVFSELLSIPSKYLVCVNAVDFDMLSALSPSFFDMSNVEGRKLQLRVIKGFGCIALKRFCGKSNNHLLSLLSHIRTNFMNEHIGIEVDVNDNEIHLYAPSEDMESIYGVVNDALKYEIKRLSTECLEKRLYRGGRAGASPPIALFGSGAEIKHLELENRYLSVDVALTNANAPDDKELLTFFVNSVSGVCGFHKYAAIGHDNDDKEKWGRLTFLTHEAARRALDLNGYDFSGSILQLTAAWPTVGGNKRLSSFAAVKAKLMWPRRCGKGYAIARCNRGDAEFVVRDCSQLLIGGRYIHCELSAKDVNSVVIRGLDREISEPEILETLQMATKKRILDLFLIRGDAVNNLPIAACEEAILKEIAPFMPDQGPLSDHCHVQVFPPGPKDSFMKAWITFNGKLHLEAAKALQHIQGKVLSGYFSWQKMQCQRVFHTSVSCPAPVYHSIERQLNIFVKSIKHRPGVLCTLERSENGSCRVKICANATKTVAELRRPLEKLMNGTTINHSSLTPSVLQLLISRDGIKLMKSLQLELEIYILFDHQNQSIRIFGPENKVALAEQKLIKSILALHDKNQTDICLRGGTMPHDLMKMVVEKYGPDLHGLKEKFPEAELVLNTRRHSVSFRGNKELRLRVEEMILEFAQSLSIDGHIDQPEDEASSCPICLCEFEDCYQLEGCAHKFCRQCLVDQLESAIRGRDCFPLLCMHKGCGTLIWLTDLKSLLPCEKLEDLFRASLAAFVASSGGTYKFCPSPDCPSVYRVAENGAVGDPFVCGACLAETCTKCHLEYHPYVSCKKYKEFKEDPDLSLKEWCKGKDHVKSCPVCGYMIEKVDGCNHVECRCGKHICWVCSESFGSSDDCYGHLRSIHLAIV